MKKKSVLTKEKILQAATIIFSEKGFRDTTIREISGKAQVNLAAINYHFRDKKSLYHAVLEDVFSRGFSRYPADFELETTLKPTPEKRLHAFIRAMFYRFNCGDGWGGMSGQGRLIARELLQPSTAFVSIVEHYINPHKEYLQTILKDIMQCDPGPEKLSSCVISIVGQCIYYAVGASVIEKVAIENSPREDNLDRLAEDVWRFSLGGVVRFRDEYLQAELQPTRRKGK